LTHCTDASDQFVLATLWDSVAQAGVVLAQVGEDSPSATSTRSGALGCAAAVQTLGRLLHPNEAPDQPTHGEMAT